MQIVSAATRRVARLFCIVRRARLVVLAVAAVGLAGCQDKHEWHQKLTVVVDTPSGKVSGSSVIAISATFGQVPLTEKEVWYRVTGEATVVEVAPGRYLFALLDGSQERYYRAVRDKLERMDRGEWLKSIPNMEGVITLKPKNYPLLVTFANVNNPKSVQRINPRDLAASFGKGYKLNRITLEISNEPITEESLLEFGFMQALQTQATLSGLEKYKSRYSDQIYYLTKKSFEVNGD